MNRKQVRESCLVQSGWNVIAGEEPFAVTQDHALVEGFRPRDRGYFLGSGACCARLKPLEEVAHREMSEGVHACAWDLAVVDGRSYNQTTHSIRFEPMELLMGRITVKMPSRTRILKHPVFDSFRNGAFTSISNAARIFWAVKKCFLVDRIVG